MSHDIATIKSLERQFIVLGSMIMDKTCLEKGIHSLKDAFFTSSRALALWNAIKACHGAGMEVDLVSVAGASKNIRITDISSATEVATVAGFDFYLERMVGEANRRECAARLMESAQRLLQEEAEPQSEAIKCAEMFDAVKHSKNTGTCRTISEAVQDRIDHINIHGYDDVFQFGIDRLDQITGGIAAGTFTVIAARPGVGKSTLAVNMAYWMHCRGYWTAYMSMEMSNIALSVAIIKLKNGVQLGKVVTKKELEKFKPTIENISMKVDHGCTGLTPSMLASKIRDLKRKHDIKMVFVDYLQLMEDDDKHKSRYEMVTRISNRLMNFAHSSGIAVVALAQINRESEKLKESREPKISDLRDSGAIEQDADMCMLLHSKEVEDMGASRELFINVAKNRAGSVGRCKFLFDASRAKFWEMEK
jgi:replicative DNA helicase